MISLSEPWLPGAAAGDEVEEVVLGEGAGEAAGAAPVACGTVGCEPTEEIDGEGAGVGIVVNEEGGVCGMELDPSLCSPL